MIQRTKDRVMVAFETGKSHAVLIGAMVRPTQKIPGIVHRVDIANKSLGTKSRQGLGGGRTVNKGVLHSADCDDLMNESMRIHLGCV